jgi:hypothetical protein
MTLEESRPTGRLWTAVETHLGSSDVGRVIYGAIIGLALVCALQAHPPAAAVTTALLIGSAVAVGLAELYSEVVATEARTHRLVRREQVRTLAVQALAVVVGAGFPAVYFALAAFGALELDTAFNLAKWTGLGLICGYGYLAARLARVSRASALVHTLAIGLIGVALIALKALLH